MKYFCLNIAGEWVSGPVLQKVWGWRTYLPGGWRRRKCQMEVTSHFSPFKKNRTKKERQGRWSFKNTSKYRRLRKNYKTALGCTRRGRRWNTSARTIFQRWMNKKNYWNWKDGKMSWCQQAQSQLRLVGEDRSRKDKKTKFCKAGSVSKWKNPVVARSKMREVLKVVGEEWKKRPSKVGVKGRARLNNLKYPVQVYSITSSILFRW